MEAWERKGLDRGGTPGQGKAPCPSEGRSGGNFPKLDQTFHRADESRTCEDDIAGFWETYGILDEFLLYMSRPED